MTRPPKTLSFSHIGIYVHDLATMVAFYQRIFGFVEPTAGSCAAIRSSSSPAIRASTTRS